MNRREFVQSAAVAAVATSGVARAAKPAPKPVRLGVIGAGSRGQEDLRKALRVPGVSVSAICDVYPLRSEQVNRIAGFAVPMVADYRKLLERDDLDAVIVATPVSLHAEHVIAVARSGRHVYGEKALGFTVEDNRRIVDEVTRAKVLFQVGSQYRYAAWVREAVRRIHAGEIGKPTHVYAYWHRNGSWRRPVPADDPGGRLERLINWRLYRDISGGLGTELGAHQIDMTNWIFGAAPESVLGTTSICKYNDGRTVGDNVQSTFNYSEGRRMNFSALTDNAKVGCELWVYGDKGSAQITLEDATFYYESSKESNALSTATVGDAKGAAKTVVERGVVTGASYATHGEMPYRGPGSPVATPNAEDPSLAAMRSFVGAVREENAIEANLQAAFRAGVACSVAHDAVFEEKRVGIPEK